MMAKLLRRHMAGLLLLLIGLALAAPPPSDDADDDALLERILQRAQERASRATAASGAQRSPKAHDQGQGQRSAVVARSNTGGASARHVAARSGGGGGGRRTRREYQKESTDMQSLITQALFQEAQRDRIRAADRDGKEVITYLAANATAAQAMQWPVTCDLDFYSKAYGTIPRCTPAAPDVCKRVVRDDFASASHCQLLLEATEAAMQNLFHRGGSTSLAAVHGKSAERLGVKGLIIFNLLINKVKMQIIEDFGLDFVFTSGALLTRLEGDPPDDEWEMDRGHIYWNAHVDKANIATYDYSALLYLNNFGTDFEGGEFEFIDNDANRVVEPRRGRLITFTSGPENLHRVRRVDGGTRYVLAMWFTCSERHQYRDDDDESAEARLAEAELMPAAAAAAEAAEEKIAVLESVNAELVSSNSVLLRRSQQLQAELALATASLKQAAAGGGGGAGGGGRAGEEGGKKTQRDKKTQGEMLQEMALSRRLSAEIEFAKKRLHAALSRGGAGAVGTVDGGNRRHSETLSGPHPGAGGDAGAGEGGGGAAGAGRVRRCYDLETCARAAKAGEVGEGGDGGDAPGAVWGGWGGA